MKKLKTYNKHDQLIAIRTINDNGIVVQNIMYHSTDDGTHSIQEFNSHGDITSEYRVENGEKEIVVSKAYSYNEKGHYNYIKDLLDGTTLTYRYDNKDRCIAVENSNNITLEYEYDDKSCIVKYQNVLRDKDTIRVLDSGECEFLDNTFKKCTLDLRRNEEGKLEFIVRSRFDKEGNVIFIKEEYVKDDDDISLIESKYEYNDNGKVIRTYTDGSLYQVDTYDTDGNIIKVECPQTEEVFTYRYEEEEY